MNEKKIRLIETGMRLFAQKGFHSTSIQEIADQSGVSKGAFYLHFSSKEDLTLNIHHYYYNDLIHKVEEVQKKSLPPKESLARQVEVFLQAFMKNKDFIIMHMRDNVNIQSETNTFMLEIRKQIFRWANDNLLRIYGDALNTKSVDASIILEGLMQSYFKWLVIDNLTLDAQRLANFIVRRTDDAIQGMLQEEETPQISREEVMELTRQYNEEHLTVERILQTMKDKVHTLFIEETKRNDLIQSIEVIEEEVQKDKPSTVVIQGMLAHFRDLSDVQEECTRLAEKLNITLL